MLLRVSLLVAKEYRSAAATVTVPVAGVDGGNTGGGNTGGGNTGGGKHWWWQHWWW